MCYWKQMEKERSDILNTTLAPATLLGFLILYSISSPMSHSKEGNLFFYPLYSDFWNQCSYVIGTWLWITIIVWSMAHFANGKYNEKVYNYITGSAYYAYISHYCFILIISVTFVRPYKLSFVSAFLLMLFGTQLLIFMTYIPLYKLY